MAADLHSNTVPMMSCGTHVCTFVPYIIAYAHIALFMQPLQVSVARIGKFTGIKYRLICRVRVVQAKTRQVLIYKLCI